MKKVKDISVEEIKNAFTVCSTNQEVIEFFGRKRNGAGYRFVEQLRKKAGIDYFDYFKKQDKGHYDANPKKCKCCGSVIPYEHRRNIFCSERCSAAYNNIKRGKRSPETRAKISAALRGKTSSCDEVQKMAQAYLEKTKIHPCKNCGKQTRKEEFCSGKCKKEFLEKEKINEWLGGKNFIRGATQVPSFIKRYLMAINNNRCEKCGWGEANEYNGKIPLEVHHIDGDCTNNLKDNLQLLCPNCHSLTNNFGSMNKESKRFHRKKITKE